MGSGLGLTRRRRVGSLGEIENPSTLPGGGFVGLACEAPLPWVKLLA